MMVLKSSVSVSGVESLTGAFTAWTGKLEKDVRDTLVKIGVAVSRGAKRRVPVSRGGGDLRQSIRWEIVPGEVPGSTDVRIGTNKFYGPFVEFGTDRIAGGAVKRIGLKTGVSDDEAVTEWAAMLARSATGQQMPWLRPAATEIRAEAMAMMLAALRGSGEASGLKFN